MVVCTSTFVSPKGRHDGMGGCRMVSHKITAEFVEFCCLKRWKTRDNEKTLRCMWVVPCYFVFSLFFDVFCSFLMIGQGTEDLFTKQQEFT